MRIVFTAALLAASVAAAAHETAGYWGDSTSKSIWNHSYGECWQTGEITKEQKEAGCEPKPAPAPVPVVVAPPPPPPVVVEPPKPEPAPAPVPVPVPAKPIDSDGDGIVDAEDKCQDTAKGAKVDPTGCYIILTEKITVGIDVKFPTGKSTIDAAGIAEIKKLADVMIQYPQTTVEVGGHTDSTGAPAMNKKLSQSRADAVRNVLIKDYGIDAARVTAKGYGPDKPVADNKTVEGRAKNRRTEGVVTQTIEKKAMKQ